MLGAASADRLFGVLDAKRMASTVAVTTDDGSAGTRGRVTDVLPEVMAAAHTDVVYACGPMAMLRAVTAVAARRGVVAQCAVEESMACGIGVCMTCVLPVVGDDGADPDGALLRGRSGVPRRPGPLGRRGHGARRHGRRPGARRTLR